MKPGVASRLIVTVQLGVIAYLAASGPLIPRNPAFLVPLVAGLVIGLWALHAMRRTRFRIGPEPAQKIDFVSKGPYRWIRHPMYSCVILVASVWVFDSPSEQRIMAWAVLLLVLGLKIHIEEKLLMKLFPRYWHYRRGTKMLIPFLF